MKRWTTDEQQDWLEGKANGFVQAQLDSDVGPYMSLVTSEWFEEFPDTMPSDEDVTKKELKKANFDMEVAKVEHKKNQLQNWFYNLLRDKKAKGKGKKAKVLDVTTQKRPGHLHPYQGYQQLYHPQLLKAKYEKAYLEYKENFEADPPAGECLKDAFQWGNEQAAIDIKEESEEVRALVDDYVLKYNTGIVRTVAEYHALVSNDKVALEKFRLEKMRKIQDAIDALPITMNTVVNNVKELTGWSITCLLGGPVPENGGELGLYSFHAGGTVPLGHLFPDATPEYVAWEGKYGSFVRRCFTKDMRKRTTLDSEIMDELEKMDCDEEGDEKMVDTQQSDQESGSVGDDSGTTKQTSPSSARKRASSTIEGDVDTEVNASGTASHANKKQKSNSNDGTAHLSQSQLERVARIEERKRRLQQARKGKGQKGASALGTSSKENEAGARSSAASESSANGKENITESTPASSKKSRSTSGSTSTPPSDDPQRSLPNSTIIDTPPSSPSIPQETQAPTLRNNIAAVPSPESAHSSVGSGGSVTGVGSSSSQSVQSPSKDTTAAKNNTLNTNIPVVPEPRVPLATPAASTGVGSGLRAPLSSLPPSPEKAISVTSAERNVHDGSERNGNGATASDSQESHSSSPGRTRETTATTSGASAAARTGKSVSFAKPDYVKNAEAAFSTISEDGWPELAQLWLRFEELSGSPEKSAVNLSTKYRPIEIQAWIRGGRPYREGAWSVKDLKTYSKKWWQWYTAAQPPWRTTPGISPLPRKDPGNEGLASLCLAGPSGLLQLVGSLFLWRSAFKKRAKPGKEYRDAIVDLTWLLKEITTKMGSGELVVRNASSSRASAKE